MADIVDYLFLFWVLLCGLVYALGSLFEHWIKVQLTARIRQSQSSYSSPGNTHYASHTSDRSSSVQQQPFLYHYHDEARQSDEYQQQSTWQEQQSCRNSSWLDGPSNAGQAEPGSVPTASGFNQDCVDWVNSLLLLIYSQWARFVPMLADSLNRSLNEKACSLLQATNSMLEFEGLLSSSSCIPELTNLRTENESDRCISATCKIYCKRLVFELNYRPLSASGLQQARQYYELSLESLEGKLKAVAMPADRLIVLQFMERPQCRLQLRTRSVALLGDQPNESMVNEDSLVSLVLETLAQMVVDLYFGDEPDFPPFKPQSQPHQQQHQAGYRQKLNEIKRHIKQDFFGSLQHCGQQQQQDKERRIFVKLISASNINYNQNVTCLIELDTPQQQVLSSTKRTSSNPSWDEHFLLDASDKSQSLQLELWDSVPERLDRRAGHHHHNHHHHQQQQQINRARWSRTELVQAGAKSLGLARVNLDELRRNPVQRVSLPLVESLVGAGSLVGRSTLQDPLGQSVAGELLLELLFLEHSAGSSGGQSLRKSQSQSSLAYQPGDVVSVDRKLTQAGYVITTTTITKMSAEQSLASAALNQQRSSRLDHQQQQQLHLSQNQLLPVRQPPSPVGSQATSTELDLDALSSNLDELSPSEGAAPSTGPSPSPRSRSRSRSFLRAIRKRFSFSRTRSRSLGERGAAHLGSAPASPGTPTPDYAGRLGVAPGDTLDASSLGSSELSGAGRAKSVPPLSRTDELPSIVINRGRLSDTASAFTFAPARSQLVIECAEPVLADGTEPARVGTKKRTHFRYYAFPEQPSAMQRALWRRRGTKLHLFNEHQFVACHLAGSSTCHLCGRVFSRRPGKQGYRCRNCHLLSHKQCHVKVDHNCPYANAEPLKLEFIDADPKTQETTAMNNQRRTDSVISCKSVSLDTDDW